ncbi:hypothetical protein SanaruYs_18110 [Chryseotalea sanaruensis]|uniref:Uncharacterized protein n=1 Tax=Chryseotalea sanaruensis TaxID=2482724 RepID=A0A401U9M2_9BACT|nr:hypothetical protein [Chryseotalea sanaruensis]GCC51585.1 hypothetical protein SanaruYs_18110 [Chryseotalea sanaruensis]
MNIEELLSSIDQQRGSKIHEFKLIHGTFKAEDAKRILLEMLNNKVNFHCRQIHRIQEHSGGNTTPSEIRMNELLDTIEVLKKVLLHAEKNNLDIKINCPITIELI